jgi:type IV pilus assembly protein PilV
MSTSCYVDCVGKPTGACLAMGAATTSNDQVANRTSGFTMIEVLIALAVLAIGLLGLAALQTTGLRLNNQSIQHTQAVLLAQEFLDRVRANGDCLSDGGCAYDSVNGFTGTIATPGPYNCVITAMPNCSSSQMATFDVAQMYGKISTMLSNGKVAGCRGVLSVTISPPSFGCVISPGGAKNTAYSIAVFWTENDLPMRLDMQVEL